MYCWLWVILFSIFCFFGGERGEEERGGFPYAHCQSAITVGGAISAIYYAIAAFLSLSFGKMFVVFHT